MGRLAEIDSRLAQTLNGTWDKGHGTNGSWDAGRGTKKWEGEAPAEPKRQRMANSDWRMVKRQIFWRAVLPHCRKFSAHQEMASASITENFRRIRRCALQFFQPALAGFVLVDTDLKRVVGRGTRDEMKNGRARLLPSQNGGEWRIASSEWRVVFWRAVLLHCRKNLLNDCTPHSLFTFARMHACTHIG
jgi:hypothetical protein